MLTAREAERWGLEGLIGRSPTMQTILDKIRLLRQSDTIRILITGESGTGKELIARAIHTGSGRREGPFIPVNCAAIPVQLAESLFFGHVRGAFTGADRDRQGYFALAHTGTLFLDEVADLAPELQPKLLRVLEDGVVVPLGSSKEQKIDARIIVASNQDLQTRVAQGVFREDLYFRLRQVAVGVPPLRDRKEDVPLLANHFLQLFAQEMAIPVPQLTDMALTRLQGYSFPGNVRELKNLVEHALLDSRGKDIQAEHLHLLPNLPMGTNISLENGGNDLGSSMSRSDDLSGFEAQNELPLNLEEAELLVIKRAVAHTHGNVAAAARLLGTNRTRIYRTLNPEKYKISS
jgi:DNA-binding NtrC family response regulator